ncbi:hypothetical protein BaRGS_00002373 [Batillaria attramentaria]|uniref:Uncharacterized protein n=1 Tax=Batillaria attramentaria TaxID=370345 RepID=A0ABD0M3D8_9CAEN
MPLELRVTHLTEDTQSVEDDVSSGDVHKLVWDDRCKEDFVQEVKSHWFKEELLTISVHDQREFWKNINKFGNKKVSQKNDITLDEWFRQFKDILDKPDNVEEDYDPPTTEENDLLDRPITSEEV